MTRCKPWDNRELDTIESFRVMSAIWIMLFGTCVYMLPASSVNPWRLFNLFEKVVNTIVVSGIIALELFIAISSFLGFYQMC